jgi:hypothetical protein
VAIQWNSWKLRPRMKSPTSPRQQIDTKPNRMNNLTRRRKAALWCKFDDEQVEPRLPGPVSAAFSPKMAKMHLTSNVHWSTIKLQNGP